MKTLYFFLSPINPKSPLNFSFGQKISKNELGEVYGMHQYIGEKKFFTKEKILKSKGLFLKALVETKKKGGIVASVEVEDEQKIAGDAEFTIIQNYQTTYSLTFDPTAAIEWFLHIHRDLSFEDINNYVKGDKNFDSETSSNVVRGINYLRWLSEEHLKMPEKEMQSEEISSKEIPKERILINFFILTYTSRNNFTTFWLGIGNDLQIFLMQEYKKYMSAKGVTVPLNIYESDDICLKFHYANDLKPLIKELITKKIVETANEAKEYLKNLRNKTAPFLVDTSVSSPYKNFLFKTVITEFCSNDGDTTPSLCSILLLK